MRTRLTVVRIAGDGVGPELVMAGSRLVEAVCGLVDWVDRPAGLSAFTRSGTTMPQETLDAVRHHRLAIKGPFSTPSGGTVRSGNFYLRRELDLFACLRPLPIDAARPVLLVRENVEDLYPAAESIVGTDTAFAVKVATRAGCERIARYAFDLAVREGRSLVSVVHKANNLKLTEGMFLQVAEQVGRDYPQVRVESVLADTACGRMVLSPDSFDVILTSNTFGDLLSSIGAAVAGSPGAVGSLNSGHGAHVAEAAHGDAAELVGRDQVNPLGFFESIRLMLAAAGLPEAARAVGQALATVRDQRLRTLDLGGSARSSEVTEFVCAQAVRAAAAT
ncbi:isocitrate/isopropylmalate family dehydrogenase [Catenuloplanes japonicus]|uniref:isocitrate/isopropylmalate family dehydrogenase n=1 Tax=Catenuloplanes japonicus TaxID=33876 RepID=UPI00052755CF|nr:isocitrate/isopropylmalate family dehydrogenase [Catenuloplanes japonicus]